MSLSIFVTIVLPTLPYPFVGVFAAADSNPALVSISTPWPSLGGSPVALARIMVRCRLDMFQTLRTTHPRRSAKASSFEPRRHWPRRAVKQLNYAFFTIKPERRDLVKHNRAKRS
jgi:hypothetical protein